MRNVGNFSSLTGMDYHFSSLTGLSYHFSSLTGLDYHFSSLTGLLYHFSSLTGQDYHFSSLFSLLHTNIQSISKHLHELDQYLELLNNNFFVSRL